MKRFLFVTLSFLFIFACKGPQDKGNPSDITEEFKVNFSVDGKTGGSISAKIKDGKRINDGDKVGKDAQVVFTATPNDATYLVESWKLDGEIVNGTNLTYPLKITKDVNVVVKFKKEENIPPPNDEFTVNFRVDGGGGVLSAKIKDGERINDGDKVGKDKDVVFTAIPNDATYSVESWKLDGEIVNGINLTYPLKITKDVNVVVKFKKEGSANLKDIKIHKIILGYPHISDRDGKEVNGADLNENKTLPDFEVPDKKFPVQVYHKTEFTVEQVFVTYKGTKEELTSTITKTILSKDYTLVENEKTSFVIDIKAEGYKPLKLTFNVTYKQPIQKFIDDVTNITIIRNKKGFTDTYGSLGKKISELSGGKTTIVVTRPDPIMTIFVFKGSGGQPKAEIKLDGVVMPGKDFQAGQNNLEVKFDDLSGGKHRIEIKLEKPGYEAGNYDFYIDYKPLLSFKSLTINGTTYNDLSQAKQIKLEADSPNPVSISGEVNEAGATVYFKRYEGNKWNKFTSPLNVGEGANLSLRMYAELEGYTPTYFPFKLGREKTVKTIMFDKIEVDGVEVANGGSIDLEKAEAKINLVITLNEKYEGIEFKFNDFPEDCQLDGSGKIATLNDLPIKKDGSFVASIVATADGYTDGEATITINHRTPTSSYIDGGSISVWDDAADNGNGVFNNPTMLVKEGENWKATLTESGHYEVVVKINRNGKDGSDISKFKLSMKDTKNSKVYFDKKVATSKISEDLIIFQYSKDNENNDINFPVGENDLEVSIYYDDETLETCNFVIIRS